jgi:DNA modification methylase
LEASKTAGGLTIRKVKLGDLHQDPANARAHDARNLEAIRASLTRFGQAEPLVVQAGSGRVIGGNGRLEAMRSLGWTDCDVVELELGETQATALGIALNRTAELATWDDETLALLLSSLKDEGELDGVGFDEAEIDALLAGLGDLDVELEDDAAPERPENPVSKLGDLWLLGSHRVLCGDATDATAVQRVLNGAKPRLMVTDAPYGVEYDPSWRNEAGVSKTKRTGKVQNDDRVDWREAWALFPGEVGYFWHAGKYAGSVATSLEACDFEIRAQIIWSKSRFALSRGAYHWMHEPAYYCVRRGSKSHWIGDRTQSTVWNIASTDDGDETTHGTQKPLECMARPMRNHDAPEVYDGFLGSGSSLIAAQLLGRACYGLELDPGYVDVIVRRWEQRTGEQAKHAETGATFAETGDAR